MIQNCTYKLDNGRCGKPDCHIIFCIGDACPSFEPSDIVNVVRCKDCHHRDPEDHKCDCVQFERVGCLFKVADDYFCAYGEK